MNSDNILTCLADISAEVNRYIEKNLLVGKQELSQILCEAVRYSALAGGKRIRPALCIITAQVFGLSSEAVMRAACAFELIHTYSLIHDDLPAMDNDDYRRGKPTNHKVYGEATAILAGDELLTLAFEWFSDLCNYGISKDKAIRIISIAAKASGSLGMIGGQMLDLQSENNKIDLIALEKIHKAKTGALIIAPTLTGAILAGATDKDIEVLREYSEKIGLLFQIADDILDVEGDAQKMGKAIGKDIALGKATFPAILGIKESHEYAQKIREEALIALSKLTVKADILKQLADFFISRKN
ncbi:MAG: polyprenyl synthetase family protein [Candidatus Riflebacteria bacterium]|nr:polyprenyl synthetase family protein [Candidatus Riflebacteria bacterium]